MLRLLRKIKNKQFIQLGTPGPQRGKVILDIDGVTHESGLQYDI